MAEDFSWLAEQSKIKSGPKKYSRSFWFLFWFFSAIFLVFFAISLEIKNNGYRNIISHSGPLINFLPAKKYQKNEAKNVIEIFSRMADGKERVFVVLFQDSEELLPGGGRVVSAALLKTKDGEIVSVEQLSKTTFDLEISKIKEGINSHSRKKILGEEVENLEFPSSEVGWSPFFPVNAKRIESSFFDSNKKEGIDGIVVISGKVMVSFLEIIGPILIDGHEGEYNHKNVNIKTKYRAELNRAIQKENREVVLVDPTIEIWEKIFQKIEDLKFQKKKELILALEKHLNQKNVLVYFNDSFSQRKVGELNWGGREKISKSDYLMIVDANLISKKTDPYITRNFEYEVDLRENKKTARLKISYRHSGMIRDWIVSDYESYLRVYVQKDSWLNEISGANFVKFEKEGEKKIFGTLVEVPLGKKREVEFQYDLPENILAEDYSLVIQKQSGVEKLQGTVRVIQKNGKVKKFKINSPRDVRLRL